MKKIAFLSMIALIGVSQASAATPQIRAHFQGSYFFAYASNADSIPHSCSFTLTFFYDDFGVEKTYNASGSFTVPANVTDFNVYRIQAPFVNPRNDVFKHNCT